MRIKPFLNISFCRSCGCPMPRPGLSLNTGLGNIFLSSPYYCPKCEAKKKQFNKKLGGGKR